MHRRLSRDLAPILALLLGAVLFACSSGSTEDAGVSTLDEASSPGPYAVGVTTLELVDTSRGIEANGEYAGGDERELVTEVWYPADQGSEGAEARDAPVAADDAPYPLIVFAHGFGSMRTLSASYTAHLASHGYIVAAPDFPETNLAAPGGIQPGGLENQPGDVSFVIDSLLEQSDAESGAVAGAIDPEQIGLTGNSWGGQTTLLTIYGDQRDERIDAAMPVTPAGCLLNEEAVGDSATPILLMSGSLDLLFRPVNVRHAYDLAHAPRYLVNVVGANHSNFVDVGVDDAVALTFVGAGAAPEPGSPEAEQYEGILGCGVDPVGDEALLDPERQRELMRTYATAFFDAYLRESDDAKSLLEGVLATDVDEAQVEFDAD
jgi:predicted dienelactone hydrolase